MRTKFFGEFHLILTGTWYNTVRFDTIIIYCINRLFETASKGQGFAENPIISLAFSEHWILRCFICFLLNTMTKLAPIDWHERSNNRFDSKDCGFNLYYLTIFPEYFQSFQRIKRTNAVAMATTTMKIRILPPLMMLYRMHVKTTTMAMTIMARASSARPMPSPWFMTVFRMFIADALSIAFWICKLAKSSLISWTRFGSVSPMRLGNFSTGIRKLFICLALLISAVTLTLNLSDGTMFRNNFDSIDWNATISMRSVLMRHLCATDITPVPSKMSEVRECEHKTMTDCAFGSVYK